MDEEKKLTEVIEIPVRLCCGQRHWGAVCPDGLVMCQLCFERVEIDRLNEVDGTKEDVCKECAKNEKAAYGGDDCFIGRSMSNDQSDTKPIDLRYTDHNGN